MNKYEKAAAAAIERASQTLRDLKNVAFGVWTSNVTGSSCWCQKTPNFPGYFPVEYTRQAGIVTGGMQLSSSPLAPPSMSR